ncbi:MAG: hypothetical protein ACXV76_09330 [Halobacteriota archaeon]
MNGRVTDGSGENIAAYLPRDGKEYAQCFLDPNVGLVGFTTLSCVGSTTSLLNMPHLVTSTAPGWQAALACQRVSAWSHAYQRKEVWRISSQRP